jgi:hypothetical protein
VNENAELTEQITALKKELVVTEKLLDETNRVLMTIPECPAHGKMCIPHALKWIKKVKVVDLEGAVEHDNQWCPKCYDYQASIFEKNDKIYYACGCGAIYELNRKD